MPNFHNKVKLTDEDNTSISEENPLPTSAHGLDHTTDVVTQLCEISRKLSILIKHSEIITEMDLGE